MSSKSHERPFAFSSRVCYNRGMEMMQDSAMLLSFVNMKLRDTYDSLDALCDDLEFDRAQLEERLAAIGCRYDAAGNCFR